MAIGFMSFGGMLTGGDDEGSKKTEQAAQIEKQDKTETKVIENNSTIANNTTVE